MTDENEPICPSGKRRLVTAGKTWGWWGWPGWRMAPTHRGNGSRHRGAEGRLDL